MNTYEINNRNEVIPYTSGRRCSDTRAWRDATELELQQQDAIKSLETELAKVTKELDEARGQRDEWRNEHDRVVREYQHRLCSLATAALEASNYPESESLTPNKTLSNQ
jgi:hypothetical protein